MAAKPQIGRCFIYDLAAKKDLAQLAGSIAWKIGRTIRVDVIGANEVAFHLDNGKFVHTERATPWMMNGDGAAVSIPPGKHVLTITAKNKAGAMSKTFAFEVLVDQPTTPPTPAPQPRSSDTGAEYPIRFPYSPIAQTEDGWTNFAPSTDSKRIYVAPSGSDANPGTIDAPVKSAAKALSMVRNGCPDWILFARGGDYGAINLWTKSGRSLSEPIVVTSYGSMELPRPKVGWLCTAKGSSVKSVAFVSLDFHEQHRDSTLAGFDREKVDAKRCVDWCAAGDCVHFEDCRFAWGLDGLCMHGPTAFILRRCVIERAWPAKGAKAQGIYVANAADQTKSGAAFTIEECVFDHNGWHDSITPETGGEHIFSHNLYLSEHAGPALVRRCIIARAASIGLQMRPGGVLEDNLLIDNRGAGFIAPMLERPELPSILRRNVCVDQNSGVGLGFEIIRTKCALVEENLVINKQPGAGKSPALNVNITTTKPFIDGDPPHPQQRNAKIVLKNNIFWKAGPANFYLFNDTSIDASGNVFSDGAQFPGKVQPDSLNENAGWSRSAGFPDPSRSIGAYQASIGGEATVAAFLREAVKQERANWRVAYTALVVNAWLRAGFGR